MRKNIFSIYLFFLKEEISQFSLIFAAEGGFKIYIALETFRNLFRYLLIKNFLFQLEFKTFRNN